MECVKMYYVFIFILLTWTVVSSEDALSIKFVGTSPNPVLVGSNVIFNWTYSGHVDKIRIIHFNFLDNDGHTWNKMLRYTVFTKLTSSDNAFLGGYCDSVEWVGNTTKNTSAFKMNNVTELANENIFSVLFYVGAANGLKTNVNQQKLIISVPPEVTLKVSDTNLTVGDIVTIFCKVIQGRPSPKIAWYHNSKVLKGATGNYLMKNEEIQHRNAGSYKCAATNDAGRSDSEVLDVIVHKKRGVGTPEAGKSSSGLSTGAIVGIVLAVLVIIVIVIIGVAFALIRSNRTPVINATTHDETQVAMVTNSENKDQVWL